MNKFKAFTQSIQAILGIKEWSKAEDKDILIEAQVEQLKTMGFSPDFLTGFSTALAAGFPEEDKNGAPKAAVSDGSKANAVVSGLLADITAKHSAAILELESIKAEKGTLSEDIAAKQTVIDNLQAKITTLSNVPEPDKGAGATHSNTGKNTVDWKDEKQLGGIAGEMYAMDRPYNQRLQAAMLARQGLNMTTAVESSLDYSTLKADLGAFYKVSWSDRLQSFLTQLPSIEKIFPLESGYQDLAVLVNIWLGEFSQSDNTESDFDNVTKGNYEFGDETLRMYSVMFAHKFKNLKALEKSWIGSFNKEGSQVIKWSFIEYLLAETAKKLFNEREQRRINGVRKEPDLNKPGKANDAADGLYEYINKRVNGFVDINSGKIVYQIKPFVLGEITQANIGEKIFQGTSQIPAVLRDSGTLSCYLPSHMIVWYHKYNELLYGQNQDYKPDLMCVKEYPSVKLIPVQNADNHQRVIWTLDGNIKTYEHVPGEMTKFNIEQQDWTLKVWSNWKESIQAQAVGYKYSKKEDMDYSRQMIFCNEYDRPKTFFIDADKDVNPSAKYHTSIATMANTSLLTITDIEDAQVGSIVSIKCGSDSKGVKIAAADKFSLLAKDWTPSKGEVIRLMKRADGKFIELGRESAATNALAFAPNATTPSVRGALTFVSGLNTTATAITDLTDAVDGETYTIYGTGTDNASTIAVGGKFILTNVVTLSSGKFIQLVKATDGKFYEVARG